jgi:hypothetical protein
MWMARKRNVPLVLICGAFVLSIGGIFEVHRATLVPVDFIRGPWGSVVFLFAGASLLLWRVISGKPSRQFSILIYCLAGLDLLSFSFGYTGFAAPADVFPTAPLYEFLQSRGDPATFRIARSVPPRVYSRDRC